MVGLDSTDRRDAYRWQAIVRHERRVVTRLRRWCARWLRRLTVRVEPTEPRVRLRGSGDLDALAREVAERIRHQALAQKGDPFQ